MQASNEPSGPHDPNRTVMQALRKACPSFAPVWEEHVAEWAPDEPPVYIDAMVFAGHIVDLIERGETTEFDGVFAAIERLLHTDDEGIRYLLTYGFLEGFQNVASHRGYEVVQRFRPWLGPETTRAWDAVHRFWGTQKLDPTPRDIPER